MTQLPHRNNDAWPGGVLGRIPIDAMADGVLACLPGAQLLRFQLASSWCHRVVREEAAPVQLLRFYRAADAWCGDDADNRAPYDEDGFGGSEGQRATSRVHPPLLGRTSWTGGLGQRREADRVAALLATVGWEGSRLPTILSVVGGGTAEPCGGLVMGSTVAGPLLRCLGVSDDALAPAVAAPALDKAKKKHMPAAPQVGEALSAAGAFKVVDSLTLLAEMPGCHDAAAADGWAWGRVAVVLKRYLRFAHAAAALGPTLSSTVRVVCGITAVAVHQENPTAADKASSTGNRRRLALTFSNRSGASSSLRPALSAAALDGLDVLDQSAASWRLAGVLTLNTAVDPRQLTFSKPEAPSLRTRIAAFFSGHDASSVSSSVAPPAALRVVSLSHAACCHADEWLRVITQSRTVLTDVSLGSTAAFEAPLWRTLLPSPPSPPSLPFPSLHSLTLALDGYDDSDGAPVWDVVTAYSAQLRRLRLTGGGGGGEGHPCRRGRDALETTAFPHLEELCIGGSTGAVVVPLLRRRRGGMNRYPVLRVLQVNTIGIGGPWLHVLAAEVRTLSGDGIGVGHATATADDEVVEDEYGPLPSVLVLDLGSGMGALDVMQSRGCPDHVRSAALDRVLRRFAVAFPQLRELRCPRAPLTKHALTLLLHRVGSLSKVVNTMNMNASAEWKLHFHKRALVEL